MPYVPAEPLLIALRARDGLLATHVDATELDRLIERHRAGLVDATNRLWRRSIYRSGRYIPHRKTRPLAGARVSSRSEIHGRMKLLWVKADFVHPTDRGAQIRTLETLKRLHKRHEIHYVALNNGNPEGVARSSEYCSRAYPIDHYVPEKNTVAFAGQLLKGLVSPLPVAWVGINRKG